MSAFTRVPPTVNPIMFADERAAWEGRLTDGSEQNFRIEAAAQKGKPVSFAIIGPWSDSSRSAPVELSRFDWIVNALTSLIIPGLVVAAIVLARKNIKASRGDRRAATRAAAVVFVVSLVAWVLGTTHFADVNREVNRIFAQTGDALFQAGLMWLTYSAWNRT